MKRFTRTAKMCIIAAACAFSLSHASGDDDFYHEEFTQRRLSGPRMGMTYVLPMESRLVDELNERDIKSLISQFGWHFEWLVSPKYAGPSFVIQAIPFLGGVEHGIVLPSASFVMGIRFPQGFEFGMGPNVVVLPTLKNPVTPALIIGIGKSLDFRGVSIPLNLAYTTNKDGDRISFVFGYAIARRGERWASKKNEAAKAYCAR